MARQITIILLRLEFSRTVSLWELVRSGRAPLRSPCSLAQTVYFELRRSSFIINIQSCSAPPAAPKSLPAPEAVQNAARLCPEFASIATVNFLQEQDSVLTVAERSKWLDFQGSDSLSRTQQANGSK